MQETTTRLDRVIFAVLVAATVTLSWRILSIVGLVLWEAATLWIGPLGTWLADLAEATGRFIGGPGAP